MYLVLYFQQTFINFQFLRKSECWSCCSSLVGSAETDHIVAGVGQAIVNFIVVMVGGVAVVVIIIIFADK